MRPGCLGGRGLAEQHMVHAFKALFARAGIEAGTQVGAVLVPGLALGGIQLRHLALDLLQQRVGTLVMAGGAAAMGNSASVAGCPSWLVARPALAGANAGGVAIGAIGGGNTTLPGAAGPCSPCGTFGTGTWWGRA